MVPILLGNSGLIILKKKNAGFTISRWPVQGVGGLGEKNDRPVQHTHPQGVTSCTKYSGGSRGGGVSEPPLGNIFPYYFNMDILTKVTTPSPPQRNPRSAPVVHINY